MFSKKIPGTKASLQNTQLLISSGIPSLDHVVGGGFPIGSIFLLEEDEYANYSKVMLKFYLAEGIVSSHSILLASMNSDPEKIISELPSPTSGDQDSSEQIQNKSSDDNDIKIAWRYKNLTPVDSILGTKLQFGHYYDLSKKMDSSLLNNCSKSLWKFSTGSSQACRNTNASYENLLSFIKTEIHNGGYNKSNSGGCNNVLRIGIESLGSPLWQAFEEHDLENDNTQERKYLLHFLYCLRAILRSACAVAFLTIPTHLFQKSDTVLNVRHLVDTAVRLDAFIGTDKENNPVLRDYHGFFYIPKLSSINTLVPYIPSTLDLAFKLRRKKFLIEKLHLPPELHDSSEREQDDGATVGCGGSGNSKIDF